MQQAITLTLVEDKQTKTTTRYAEPGDELPNIGQVYVPDRTVARLGRPRAIEITIRAVELDAVPVGGRAIAAVV